MGNIVLTGLTKEQEKKTRIAISQLWIDRSRWRCSGWVWDWQRRPSTVQTEDRWREQIEGERKKKERKERWMIQWPHICTIQYVRQSSPTLLVTFPPSETRLEWRRYQSSKLCLATWRAPCMPPSNLAHPLSYVGSRVLNFFKGRYGV